MTTFSDFDFKAIGDRLKQARQAANITQEVAASRICVARTTLVAIEKGQRKLKEVELVNLCKVYNILPSSILTSSEHISNVAVRYRRDMKRSTLGDEGEVAVDMLLALSMSSVKLEENSGYKTAIRHLPSIRLNKYEIKTQAEDAAASVRQILGVGQAPIADLLSLLEFELGFRVFSRPINSLISGVYIFQKELGHCVLLNSKHPLTRRIFSAAHELGHAISSPGHVDVSMDKGHANSIEERFANYFASALLMPTLVIRKYFDSYRSNGVFSANNLVLMAKIFHVSPEAVCRWLEENSLLKSGTYDSMRRRGFSPGKFSSKQDVTDCLSLLPKKTSLLALNAYEKGIFSEGQLAEMFKLDRVELRNIFDMLELSDMNQ